MSGETISGEKSKDEKKMAVPTKYVKLNVGGSLFYTTLGTLTKRADSMLRAMFSGRMEVLTDTEGLLYWALFLPYRVDQLYSFDIFKEKEFFLFILFMMNITRKYVIYKNMEILFFSYYALGNLIKYVEKLVDLSVEDILLFLMFLANQANHFKKSF